MKTFEIGFELKPPRKKLYSTYTVAAKDAGSAIKAATKEFEKRLISDHWTGKIQVVEIKDHEKSW